MSPLPRLLSVSLLTLCLSFTAVIQELSDQSGLLPVNPALSADVNVLTVVERVQKICAEEVHY